jgi:hypothetical protein
MSYLDSFLSGAMTGLGMWIMMTVMGILTFFFLKNRIATAIAKFWADVKEKGLKLDGIKIEGSLRTKKDKKPKS